MLTEEAVNLNNDNVEKYKARCVELTKDYPDEFTDVEILRELICKTINKGAIMALEIYSN